MATGTQKLGACLCKGIRDSDVKSSRTSWPRGQNFVLVLKDLSSASALASRICPRLKSLIRDYLRHAALQLKHKRENVAINDVLPLKAARRDAIANLKCFGASDTRDLISMVTFAFTMRRHLIRLA